MKKVIAISQKLADQCDALNFAEPVRFCYNPLQYASNIHHQYLTNYAHKGVKTILLGMNPGPFGMAQTGVPFGEVEAVKSWLNLAGQVAKPHVEHPKRPVLGFECSKSEVSGRRLWGWAKNRYGQPNRFFQDFFVWNYCPLSFMEESGRNRTPDKLPASERDLLFKLCDDALLQLVETLKPEWVIGVGKFAETRAAKALASTSVKIGTILHPSPASPLANRGWEEQIEKQLDALQIT